MNSSSTTTTRVTLDVPGATLGRSEAYLDCDLRRQATGGSADVDILMLSHNDITIIRPDANRG
jgi:hypothetical protein